VASDNIKKAITNVLKRLDIAFVDDTTYKRLRDLKNCLKQQVV